MTEKETGSIKWMHQMVNHTLAIFDYDQDKMSNEWIIILMIAFE